MVDIVWRVSTDEPGQRRRGVLLLEACHHIAESFIIGLVQIGVVAALKLKVKLHVGLPQPCRENPACDPRGACRGVKCGRIGRPHRKGELAAFVGSPLCAEKPPDGFVAAHAGPHPAGKQRPACHSRREAGEDAANNVIREKVERGALLHQGVCGVLV